MKKATTNTIKNWLILLLLLTNLSTILSFSYQRKKVQENLEQRYPVLSERPRGGRLLMNSMNFDPHQLEAFRTHQREFRRGASGIARKLEQKRIEFVNELSKENPSMDRLEEISEDIGNYHRLLKMETVIFYNNLKEECRPEQMDELKSYFKELSAPNAPFERGRNHRMRGRNSQQLNRNMY